jgi:hypothetical protein
MSRPDSCSVLSLSLGEPLPGSASHAQSWLLVEQPGPWGRFALRESRLDPEIGAELERRCAQAGVTALLVKRPGRAQMARRRVLAGCSRPGEAFLESLQLSSADELLALDLEGLARGRSLGGEPLDGPVYLVCTNGKRDACCARRGRPIAAALAAARPEATWECSHTGGHRFAGVLICLPDGLVYGRLDPESALRVVDAYERRQIEPAWFRGRSAYEGAVQAADAYLRMHERIRGLDDLVVVGGDDGSVLLERHDGVRFAVRVRAGEAEPPRPSSCRDLRSEGKRPLVWVLESIERLQAASSYASAGSSANEPPESGRSTRK